MLELNKIHQGDCLELMKNIDNNSIDLIICDLPYGITEANWDSIIDLEKLWKEYKRISKETTPIILTARNPFSSKLIMSNLKGYKHKWVWNKKQSGSFANAKYMPLQIEEDILAFTSKGAKINYFPIMRTGKMRKKGGSKKQIQTMSKFIRPDYFKYSDQYYPTNIIEIPNCSNKKDNIHPTQKPVELFEYLIKTYSKKNDLVLDNCIGSGTTGVACIRTKRNWIGIELKEEYINLANKRLSKEKLKKEERNTNLNLNYSHKEVKSRDSSQS